MKQARVLWAGYCALGAGMAGLILINPNRFTSIDSGYYLHSAIHLLAGRGYVIQENGQLIWNSTFPIGYSALIASLARLAGIPVLIASKLVNYAAIGVSLHRWEQRVGAAQTCWLLSIWGLGSFLKIAVYTWSETLFLVLLAEWVWYLHQLYLKPTLSRTAALMLIGLCVWLTRYVGGFVFGVTAVLAITQRLPRCLYSSSWNGRIATTVPQQLWLISMAGFVSLSTYFWLNWHLSGSCFGGDRFLPTESASDLVRMFGLAVLNEGLLIRDFVVVGSNQLAWVGLVLELLLAGALYGQLRRNGQSNLSIPTASPLARLFLFTAGSYLLVLFILRTVSPFSAPNLRLMAPFTFCLLMAVTLWLGEWPMRQQRVLRNGLVLLWVLSWLQLVPQANVPLKLDWIWVQFRPVLRLSCRGFTFFL